MVAKRLCHLHIPIHIRDQLPEIIEVTGKRFSTTVLSAKEYAGNIHSDKMKMFYDDEAFD
ncbi:hypothetical protein AN963_07680 [Brevibacillus choshinensis]|uniref:Uncharacterized protein n=1 Tax=Brevibacillus choshinensis TaxID=54911 RepID=A0ABR5NDZ5_BRECH|nr:hypothetical protein [Brevibacillus choshinensis]KQL49601.1 hypothetical protein AN963_07680 [Brevibacillus choshinensis]